jgi:hypothetical protein
MARSDQTAFLFEVLEGPLEGQAKELTGRMLPFRPSHGGSLSFGVEQRVKTTFYPGSREGSQQIAGPKLSPTTINGHWSARYLGEDTPIALVEFFSELCSQGVRVRVSWQTRTNEGVIKSFKETPGQTTGGRDEIAWEMVLEWAREVAGPRVPRVQSMPATSVRDACADVAVNLADVGEQLLGFTASAEFFVGLGRSIFGGSKAELEESVEDLGPALAACANAAARAGIESELSRSDAEATLATLETSRGALSRASAVLAELPPGVVREDDGLPAVLADERERRALVERAIAALRQQWVLEEELESRVRPTDHARVVAVAGQDLRALSNRYYGTPDRWRLIRRANGFDGDVVPEGVGEVIVPLLASGEERA